MTTEDLLEKIGEVLSEDAILSSWCNAKLGKQANICVGIDEEEPPAEEDYPLIALLGIDQDRGLGETEQRWTLTMAVGIVEPDIILSTNGQIRTRKGFLSAEGLRESAENAIYRAKVLPARSASNSSSVCFHPLYVSFTAFHFKTLRRL